MAQWNFTFMLLRKMLDVIIGCWPTRSFLWIFTSIILFLFPGLAKCFKWGNSHVLCLHISSLTFDLFGCCFLSCSISFINSPNKSRSASSISLWLVAVPGALSSALRFSFHFFTSRLYRSRTNLWVILKKRLLRWI